MTRTFHGKQLKVGGAIYTINEVKGLVSKVSMYGNVDFSDCIIQIDANISDERKEQTLIHEMLHAVHFEAGYDPSEQDEDMINRTANVLHQVIVDNIDILATPDEEEAIKEGVRDNEVLEELY
jgi:Zn-dependent peptidase ImmA (M78 family)